MLTSNEKLLQPFKLIKLMKSTEYSMEAKVVYKHPEGKLELAIGLFGVQSCPVVMTELRILFYSDKLLL